MSRRTSEANKAIAAAWTNEQELVREGKGTRDWTPEQQRDILDKGKAYDENGKAFEGHHMKSAEAFPEYQGDSKNIQFLSRPEHFQAHNGNFQNPTNGYYDVKTGTTTDFGNHAPEPPKVENLSNSIINERSSQSHNKITSQTVASEKGGGARAPNASADNVKCGENPPPNKDEQQKKTSPNKNGETPDQTANQTYNNKEPNRMGENAKTAAPDNAQNDNSFKDAADSAAAYEAQNAAKKAAEEATKAAEKAANDAGKAARNSAGIPM